MPSPKEVGGDHVLDTLRSDPEDAGSHEASDGPIRKGLAFFEGPVGPDPESLKELREGEPRPRCDFLESVVTHHHLHPGTGRIRPAAKEPAAKKAVVKKPCDLPPEEELSPRLHNELSGIAGG